jgi:aminopeptidase
MEKKMGKNMVKGAKNALKTVLSLRAEDRVLIVTDEEKREIGEAFKSAAQEIGALVSVFYLDEKNRPIEDIPDDLKRNVEEKEVIINSFKGMAEETPFRIKLIKLEAATNARVGHAPGITQSMMTDGPMSANYEEVAKAADHLMGLFRNAESVDITAPGGTDIVVKIENRDFETDVVIKAGTFGNLPAGEIWCGPIETGANGIIVCDGSIGDAGQVPAPLRIEVKDGRIASMECADASFRDRLWDLTHVDDMSDIIGELGIGLNPMARLTGNLLEDEKAGRTAHVAFGNNEDMPGGRNTSSTHRDFLFYKPTMKVSYKDGSVKEIISDGEIVA